jgi:tRNA1Val (adenine37-N6)-methyltransferase
MSNTWFQFKQFTVHQDQCALKVCTDASIFGAWFAAKVPEYSSILDIGSGTGLLMLMLAQKTNAEIHGIEINLPCFKQLKENLAASRWKDRFKVFPGDVRSYAFKEKYDFIISNPPFFENDLSPEAEEEQVAKHSKSLTLDALAVAIDDNLQPYGACGILLPYHRWEYFNKIAGHHNLHLTEKLFVKQTGKHPFFRAILHYSRSRENFIPEFELTIQGDDGNYTPEFVELMKDYYLKL